MSYKDLKAEFNARAITLALTSCQIQTVQNLARMRDIIVELDNERAQVADAARVLAIDFGYDDVQLQWGSPESIIDMANRRTVLAAEASRSNLREYQIEAVLMTCAAWPKQAHSVGGFVNAGLAYKLGRAAGELASDWLKTRERTADSARFLFLHGMSMSRQLLQLDALDAALIAKNASQLQVARGQAANAAQWLYLNTEADPKLMQAIFRRSTRADIIRDRGLFE